MNSVICMGARINEKQPNVGSDSLSGRISDNHTQRPLPRLESNPQASERRSQVDHRTWEFVKLVIMIG